jgi:hypothetical protein
MGAVAVGMSALAARLSNGRGSGARLAGEPRIAESGEGASGQGTRALRAVCDDRSSSRCVQGEGRRTRAKTLWRRLGTALGPRPAHWAPPAHHGAAIPRPGAIPSDAETRVGKPVGVWRCVAFDPSGPTRPRW